MFFLFYVKLIWKTGIKIKTIQVLKNNLKERPQPTCNNWTNCLFLSKIFNFFSKPGLFHIKECSLLWFGGGGGGGGLFLGGHQSLRSN
jgi:hypothetical protein